MYHQDNQETEDVQKDKADVALPRFYWETLGKVLVDDENSSAQEENTCVEKWQQFKGNMELFNIREKVWFPSHDDNAW